MGCAEGTHTGPKDLGKRVKCRGIDRNTKLEYCTCTAEENKNRRVHSDEVGSRPV